MEPHVDILEQPESLAKPFWESVALHLSFVGAIFLLSTVVNVTHIRIGSPTGGGMGSVAINVVSTIRLPSNGGPENPVANDTRSAVPEPPAKAKAKPEPKAKRPDLNAIPLKMRNAKPSREPASPPNKWREQQKDLPNQLYSRSGQALSSSMYQMPGGGGVGIGDNSPFGQQFGSYGTILRDKVAQNWKTNELNQRILQAAPSVVVTFTVNHDGSVSGVTVSRSSGNAILDLTAKRAILDASPFPPLPDGFPRNRADVELRFELGH